MIRNIVLTSILSFLLIACNSNVDVALNSDGNLNGTSKNLGTLEVSLEALTVDSETNPNVVSISIPFSGDANDDAIVRIYYCSITKSAGCNPMSGEYITLSKSDNNFVGQINISTSTELSAGDIMKYKLSSSDIDGVIGGTDKGFVVLGYDNTVARALRQIGRFKLGSGTSSAGADYFKAMAKASDGSIYIAGHTAGDLGEYNGGSLDAFVMKFKPDGSIDTDFGNNGFFQYGLISADPDKMDNISDIVLDDSEENIFIVGFTMSALSGSKVSANYYDGFVIKINALNGVIDNQFGDGDGEDDDGIVQFNNSNTNDSFYSDYVKSVEYVNGNLFIIGNTSNSLGGTLSGSTDGFVIKLNALSGILDTGFGSGDGVNNDGILQLNASILSFASSAEYPTQIRVDESNNLFILGNSGDDIFILKMDTSGGLVTSFGNGDGSNNDGVVVVNSQAADASGSEFASDFVLDNSGNLYIAGYTQSNFSGTLNGSVDPILIKMSASTGVFDSDFGDNDGVDNDGILLVNANIANTVNSDYGYGVGVDNLGGVYLAGQTNSLMSGLAVGGITDIFILKVDSTHGVLDTSFGDGDGVDDDGIVLLNDTQTINADNSEGLAQLFVDSSGYYLVGETPSPLSGGRGGGTDGYIIKGSLTSGAFDTTFGSGDGGDNDGIFQLNIVYSGDVSVGDYVREIVKDSSDNLYLIGETSGSLSGVNDGALTDVFVIKINAVSGALDKEFGDGDGKDNDGVLQFNSLIFADASERDYGTSGVLDGLGNLYVGGYSQSDIAVAANGYDAFIVKIDTTNGLLDSTFGDGDGIDDDGILQLTAINAGDVSSHDYINKLAVDGAGNLYFAGKTFNSLSGTNAGSWDAFVGKADTTNGLLDSDFGDGDGANNDGIVQFNASNTDSASGIEELDSLVLDGLGNIYLGGKTTSVLSGSNGGGGDSYIIKIDTTHGVVDSEFGDGDGANNDGIVQFNAVNTASASGTESHGFITLDPAGGAIYLAGSTTGVMSGSNSGLLDAYVIKIDTTHGVVDSEFGDGDGTNNDGILQFNDSVVTDASSADYIYSLVADSSGNLYLGFYSISTFTGTSGGSYDIIVGKIETTNGAFDSDFGDNDGTDNDGLLHFNNLNSTSATGSEVMNTLILDETNNILYGGGYTTGSLDGEIGGSTDILSIRIDLSSGSL